MGNLTYSKSKFHHQICSKLTSMTPLLYTKSAATFVKRHSAPRTWKSRGLVVDACSFQYNYIAIIIESVDSINRDERGFPLT